MMDRLRDMVRNKTVAVILHGKSVVRLRENIFPLQRAGVCYITINNFREVEDRVVGRHMDVLYCSSETEMVRLQNDIQEFLNRPEPNLLITTKEGIEVLPHPGAFLSRYFLKLYVVPKPPLVQGTAPNSLSVALRELTRVGAGTVLLFGCDGYCGKKAGEKASYFCPEIFCTGRYSDVGRDTAVFNSHYPAMVREWEKAWGNKLTVVNVNPASHITVFPKIDYSEVEQWV